MKVQIGAINQEKALVGAFSVKSSPKVGCELKSRVAPTRCLFRGSVATVRFAGLITHANIAAAARLDTPVLIKIGAAGLKTARKILAARKNIWR